MSLILTTTERVPGWRHQVLGLLIEQEIVGMNVARDVLAKIKDFFGGTVHSYDQPIKDGLSRCLARIRTRAEEAGGDALVSMQVSLTPVPFNKMTMVQVCIYGTAVRFVAEDPVCDA